MTWNVKVVVALPPEFVAVTVYVAELDITVGVPLITPVTVSNWSPDGRDGVIAQDVTVPPLLVGVAAGVNSRPLVRM